MMASGLCAVRQEPGLKGEADGLKDRDVPSSGRLKDGPDTGVERGPHSDRKQLVTLLNTTQGRSACSEPLLVGGTARLVTNTKRFWRKRLMIRWSFCPAAVVGVIASKVSSLF